MRLRGFIGQGPPDMARAGVGHKNIMAFLCLG